MSLQHSIRPCSFPSNEISTAEDGRTSLSILPINNFDDGIRYLQRTLLGFDADNPQISFSNPGFLPWQEQVHSVQMANENTSNILVVPGFESLYITAKDICYVNYLPAELLREIFSYLLPGRDWKLEARPPPQLALVEVCSYWRDIALSYPTLWSTFMIVHPIERHIPMTKLWLERSRNRPLTLYIDHQNLEFEEACTTTDTVIDLLRPHVHRWKAVTFIFAVGIQSSLLTLPRNEFPLLETFCFDVTGTIAWCPDDVERVEDIFFPSSSPKLREVTWETRGLSLRRPPLPMVPTNITCLSGDFLMDFAFFNSLSNLKYLQTLRLHGGIRSGLVPSPHPTTVILPHLHALELRTSFCTPYLLDSIATPSLKILVIASKLDEKTQKTLCSFIQRCRCRLSAFSYLDGTGDDLENQFFEEFLVSTYMDLLCELNILSDNVDAVLSILANMCQSVLPSLNRLWISTWCCSGDLLLDMLQRRAEDFPPPTGDMMSETLFCTNYPHPCQYLFIPVSGYSLCIQATWLESSFEEVSDWFNARAHWNMLTSHQPGQIKF
ncbi:hypothetical protein F5877DRAFT_78264 [Lentinula edodes]|nr:hypothetical protein F5877DRAFT_78264 [Lentinula edodes]